MSLAEELSRRFPTRKSVTADGSVLLQLIGKRAAVDIYPTGEVIVLIREGETQHVHEFTVEDVDKIVSALGESDTKWCAMCGKMTDHAREDR